MNSNRNRSNGDLFVWHRNCSPQYPPLKSQPSKRKREERRVKRLYSSLNLISVNEVCFSWHTLPQTSSQLMVSRFPLLATLAQVCNFIIHAMLTWLFTHKQFYLLYSTTYLISTPSNYTPHLFILTTRTTLNLYSSPVHTHRKDDPQSITRPNHWSSDCSYNPYAKPLSTRQSMEIYQRHPNS